MQNIYNGRSLSVHEYRQLRQESLDGAIEVNRHIDWRGEFVQWSRETPVGFFTYTEFWNAEMHIFASSFTSVPIPKGKKWVPVEDNKPVVYADIWMFVPGEGVFKGFFGTSGLYLTWGEDSQKRMWDMLHQPTFVMPRGDDDLRPLPPVL